jgi:hypothetical protein
MSLVRRVRGLVGTALIWGVMGAIAGVGVFIAVFRPWPLRAETLPRALTLFARWELGSTIWGIATGLTFGLVVLALERTRGWRDLSKARITAWGALAGALFPTLLSIRPIQSGSSVTYFGLIIGGSALAGALWARTSFALARRTGDEPTPALLPADTSALQLNSASTARDLIER